MPTTQCRMPSRNTASSRIYRTELVACAIGWLRDGGGDTVPSRGPYPGQLPPERLPPCQIRPMRQTTTNGSARRRGEPSACGGSFKNQNIFLRSAICLGRLAAGSLLMPEGLFLLPHQLWLAVFRFFGFLFLLLMPVIRIVDQYAFRPRRWTVPSIGVLGVCVFGQGRLYG